MASVSDIAKIIEEWAPPSTAQSYDNVGLQVGRAERSVSRVIVALDLTPEVVDEAIRENADLIITHHPLLFRPLKTLTGGDFVSGLALRLAESGIALYAAHTNLDAARDGVSFALASSLDLRGVEFLTTLDDSLCKLVTFVPESHELLVREAIAAAGGGRIGNYDSCAFAMRGVGYFRAGEGAKPAVGAADGTVQSVEEVRIEAEVPTWRVAQTIAALRSAHPYEEVAYDIYPQNRPYSGAGLGAIGDLPGPTTVSGFLAHVAATLNADVLRFSGPDEAEISRVAVCGGAGADLIDSARRAGAQAYVTSDISYHRFFDVSDEHGTADLLLVDAGHYETEAETEQLLVERLRLSLPELEFHRTTVRTSPVRTFTRS
jgi:dinuclear metal center YbgI/SA1388 family protein